MRKFTKFALFTAAIAGGYYLYKQVEKQKELAEGEVFEDDDLFEDDGEIAEVTKDVEEGRGGCRGSSKPSCQC